MPAPHHVLRGRHPPRVPRPRPLQLELHEAEPTLELALVVLETSYFTAQSPELLAQGLDVVAVDGLGRGATRRRRRQRAPSDRDLLVRRPVLLPGRSRRRQAPSPGMIGGSAGTSGGRCFVGP